MFDHEIKAYSARVAFCAKLKRSDFTDEEMMLIENCYHYGEPPEDAAYMIETFRVPAGITEDEE